MNKQFLIAAIAACLTSPAFAGNLQISPVGMTLPPQQRVERMKIINHNKTPSSLQLQAFVWTQVNGKDVEVPTTNIRFSPAIVEVPAGGEQIVRVIRMTPPIAKEDTYRMRVSELPPKETVTKVGAGAVLLLTYNLPLFFRPQGAEPSLSYRWEGSKLVVTNTGQGTAQLSGIGNGTDKPWKPGLVGYVLPGSTMKFDVAGKAPSIKVHVNGAANTVRLE